MVNDFKKPLPEWNEPGIEPPQSKKDTGWQEGDRPPAPWHNWFQNRVYEALKELQENALHKDKGVDTTEIEQQLDDIEKDIGNVSELDTEIKDNLVASINELKRLLATHSADLTSQEVEKGASLVGINDSTGLFTATNVEGALKEAIEKANSAFTSASNGKSLVGNAITGVDDSIDIPTDPTFQQLASLIGSIKTEGKFAYGTESVTFTSFGSTQYNILRVYDLDFTPGIVYLHPANTSYPHVMINMSILRSYGNVVGFDYNNGSTPPWRTMTYDTREYYPKRFLPNGFECLVSSLSSGTRNVNWYAWEIDLNKRS